jgi:hypothetical protein
MKEDTELLVLLFREKKTSIYARLSLFATLPSGVCPTESLDYLYVAESLRTSESRPQSWDAKSVFLSKTCCCCHYQPPSHWKWDETPDYDQLGSGLQNVCSCHGIDRHRWHRLHQFGLADVHPGQGSTLSHHLSTANSCQVRANAHFLLWRPRAPPAPPSRAPRTHSWGLSTAPSCLVIFSN